jgi:hypothetical protein
MEKPIVGSDTRQVCALQTDLPTTWADEVRTFLNARESVQVHFYYTALLCWQRNAIIAAGSAVASSLVWSSFAVPREWKWAEYPTTRRWMFLIVVSALSIFTAFSCW